MTAPAEFRVEIGDPEGMPADAMRVIRDLSVERGEAVAALRDALSGLEYIRQRYGALNGAGWDRIKDYRKRWMEADDGE